METAVTPAPAGTPSCCLCVWKAKSSLWTQTVTHDFLLQIQHKKMPAYSLKSRCLECCRGTGGRGCIFQQASAAEKMCILLCCFPAKQLSLSHPALRGLLAENNRVFRAWPTVCLCSCWSLFPFQRTYCILLTLLSFCSREHPVFFMFVQLAIISIFKSYPTVGDVALYMAFLPVWSHLYRCKFFVFDCSPPEWEAVSPVTATTNPNPNL